MPSRPRPVISTKLYVKPELLDEAIQYYRGIEADVAANEPGTLFYRYNQSKEDPTVFLVHEIFADETAQQHHLDRLQGDKELIDKIYSFSRAEPEVNFAQEISPS